MKVTIDRFEGRFAVLQTRSAEPAEFDLPVWLLPDGCQEGDILDFDVSVDRESTDEAHRAIDEIAERMRKKK